MHYQMKGRKTLPSRLFVLSPHFSSNHSTIHTPLFVIVTRPPALLRMRLKDVLFFSHCTILILRLLLPYSLHYLGIHPPTVSDSFFTFLWVCLRLPCVFCLSTHTENDLSVTRLRPGKSLKFDFAIRYNTHDIMTVSSNERHQTSSMMLACTDDLQHIEMQILSHARCKTHSCYMISVHWDLEFNYSNTQIAHNQAEASQ